MLWNPSTAARSWPAAVAPAAIAAAIGCSRGVLQRPGEAQHLALVGAGGGVDSDEAHHSRRHRAGLVEHDRVDRARRLEHLGSLDDDAELGAATGADHDRRRCGQAEGARAGDDQHRDRGRDGDGRRLTGAEPEPERGGGDGDHGRDEHRGDAVGEALHRCLAGLGVVDEAGDLGELGVGADAHGAHDEPAAGVDGAAGDASRRARPRRGPVRR